ncbi:MAG TPA: ASCH domain-containing protein [Polyangiaceae bacterium]|jgi:hypothetical protein
MRALTIRQPWATLIARGEKTVELRSWSTPHRGPLLVHAGVNVDRKELRDIDLRTSDMPKGVLLCVVEVLDVVRATREHMRRAWDPEADPSKWFAWEIRKLYSVERRPWSGKLGFMNVPDSEIVRVETPDSEGASVGLYPSLYKGRLLTAE